MRDYRCGLERLKNHAHSLFAEEKAAAVSYFEASLEDAAADKKAAEKRAADAAAALAHPAYDLTAVRPRHRALFSGMRSGSSIHNKKRGMVLVDVPGTGPCYMEEESAKMMGLRPHVAL